VRGDENRHILCCCKETMNQLLTNQWIESTEWLIQYQEFRPVRE
jgi:hypothetical protein